MRLLDLFSCEGGASMGYHRAGFDVYGVDLFTYIDAAGRRKGHTRSRYPFASLQSDAVLARQSIPPAYTEHIGRQLIEQIGEVAA